MLKGCIQSLVFVGVFVAIGAWGAPAQSATFYIAPNGNNSNNGTSPGTAWRTFSHALNPARAWCGDTLVLRNGTYGDGTSTGKINLEGAKCSAGSKLTIRAENQRKAKIVDNGSGYAVRVHDSTHVILDGLYARSADADGKSPGLPITARFSTNIIIRNCVARNPNRYANTPVYSIFEAHKVLMEDNEAYVFHRHCVTAWRSSEVTVRRQYCNPRGGKIAGTIFTRSNRPGTGDAVFSMYPCKGCILENSIADGTTHGMFLNEMNASYGGRILMSGSKILGSICYKCSALNGIYANARSAADLNHTPQNITIKDVALVDFNSRSAAIRVSNGVKITIEGVTITGGGSGVTGISLDDTSVGATPSQQSIVLRNATAQRLTGRGFSKASSAYNTWSASNLNSFNNGTNFSPSLPANWGNASTTDPKLGACKVWIPASSPLKGAGTGGSDIGANILYRYVDGVLTKIPLWDPSSGAFPHGAEDLDGTNRVAGQSLFDIHKRLNVNTSGCPFPAGYGNGTTPPPPPPSAVCGQNGCESGETCGSCPQDCGPCASSRDTMAVNAGAGITVDGRLDDCGWSDAAWESFSNTDRSDNTVKFSTAWDATNLYLGVEVSDAQLESDGSGIWQNDGIESFSILCTTRPKRWKGMIFT